MNTKEITQEQISALADGELSPAYVDVVLAALRQTQSRADWDVYHQIGDILRSDDMALGLRPDFARRMAARLDAEPSFISHEKSISLMTQPQIVINGGGIDATITTHRRRSIKRLALPGMVAAVVAVTFIAMPQVIKMNGQMPVVAVATPPQRLQLAPIFVTHSDGSLSTEILRDPRMDEYLLAHQHFSPSPYSAAHYARSATFAIDTNR